MTNNYQCRICNNTQGHQLIVAHEMMFGFRDEFLYFKCPVCGCLQISEMPEDLAKYYPQDYYSYRQAQTHTSSNFKRIIKHLIVNAYMRGLTILKYGPYLKKFGISKLFLLEILRNFNKNISILDIGCGSGHLLLEMKSWGYSDLTGIDPFIEKDILYPSGVKILKQTVSEHKNKYDLIMLHHSFEHMLEPHAAFKDLNRILNVDGLLLMRIPVSDSFAFRKYQNNWFQLDAPRHFFLHTTKSISYLAKSNGFIIKDIIYDSTESQILSSEGYCKDISLLEQKRTLQDIKRYKKFIKHLNDIKDGDQCCFILEKDSENFILGEKS
jgi:2-polyprenyl-3-methyl-5-hydroxy-6-metoxy-1,4-benzoquinol methylase